jgi:hypothetical protein
LRSARAARLPLVPVVSLEPEVPLPLAPIDDDEPVEPEALGLDELDDELLGLVELDELLGVEELELEPAVLGVLALEPVLLLEPEAPIELLLLGVLLPLALGDDVLLLPLALGEELLLPLALGVVLPLLPVLDVSAAVLGALELPLVPEAPIVLDEPVDPEPAGAVLEPVLEPVPAPTPVPTVPPAPPPEAWATA